MSTFRITIVFIIAALLVSMFAGVAAGQDETPDLSGVELTLMIHPTLHRVILGGEGGLVQEFEAASGAAVEVVTAPIPEHSQKALVEFIAGRGTYDVIAMQNSDFTPNFVQFFLPLDDYIARDGEEMAWEDFIGSLRNWGLVDDQQLGVPIRSLTAMLYFRKDLLDAAGVEVPTTLAELQEAARKLTMDTDGDGETDVYGLVARGLAPSQLAHDWLNTFYASGGNILVEDGSCGLGGAEALTATEHWVSMFQEGIFPPDIFAWGRDDYITAMQQGRAAMGVYQSAYVSNMLNPEESTVVDQVGWALPPSVEGVPLGRSRSGGWLLVINKFSENPDAAWEFIKYVTSVEAHTRGAVEFGNGPSRASAFASEGYLAKFPMAILWSEGTANSTNDPAINELPELHDAITTEVTAAMQGEQTAEEAVANLCERFDEILG